jgi:hypothetical protein
MNARLVQKVMWVACSDEEPSLLFITVCNDPKHHVMQVMRECLIPWRGKPKESVIVIITSTQIVSSDIATGRMNLHRLGALVGILPRAELARSSLMKHSSWRRARTVMMTVSG